MPPGERTVPAALDCLPSATAAPDTWPCLNPACQERDPESAGPAERSGVCTWPARGRPSYFCSSACREQYEYERAQLAGPTGVIAVATDDGVERDLTWVPEADTEVELIQRDSPAGLAIIRHSTTHIMAQAVQNLFPSARLGIGPPTAEGFYYDFLTDHNFTPDDLVALEEEMRRLVGDGQLFRRRVLTSVGAAEAEAAQEPLKQELIATHPVPWRFEGDPYGEDALSYYDNLSYDGDRKWTDLCRGPHVLDTKYLGVFTLTHAAAAYWRGDEKRPQLQRIYGTAFLDRKALKTYLSEREERLKRDHRKLGEQLDLFTFDEHIGKGLPLWLPNGTIVRDELEKWARETERAHGYKRVVTPQLAKEDLYYLSGHLPYYADDMYAPVSIEDETYYLRPMNCPHHHMVYRARPKSYRDLPYKIGEYGTVYRFEKSGQLQGLMRTRGFTQNDAHIYCTDEQAEEQFLEVMRMHEMYYQTLGITDFHMVLAVRDPENTEKYHDDEEMWQRAEAITRGAMEKSGIPFVLDVGGAAHYGPKIDFIIKSVAARSRSARHRSGCEPAGRGPCRWTRSSTTCWPRSRRARSSSSRPARTCRPELWPSR